MAEEKIYSQDGDTYLDIQAELGITKHMGGYDATDRLYELCHVAEADTLLDAGCGIGVGPVHLAQVSRGEVTAVDVSPKMLDWTRQRAEQEGVADRIKLQQADVTSLPFEDDSFDAVIAESVLSFVQDKHQALNELIRVTKPGGYVGINESYWRGEAPDMDNIKFQLGAEILTLEEWKRLWSELPLQETAMIENELTIKQEVKDRIAWVGWRYILPAWGRLIGLLWRNPKSRQSIKSQMSSPVGLYLSLGYGLFVGRKPQ